jgi:hypothetical protein
VYTGSSLRALTDGALLARLETLVAQERESTADVVEHLMEVERREIAIDLAYPSVFWYCVKKLGYSEAAAFARIRAARAAAAFPDVLTRLRAGSLHLEAIVRLYPYLDQDNSRDLLDRASGASKQEVLTLLAQLQPEPGAQRDVIVPVRSVEIETPLPSEPSGDQTAPASGDKNPREEAQIIPAPQHRFHFTADAELLEMVGRIRGLLRHKIPDGRLEMIFKEAAKALLARLDRDKNELPPRAVRPPTQAKSENLRQGSRVVPRTVKRAVWTRDGGRCAYEDPHGRRCESRDALEYDHIVAWADGGRSDTPDNIRLLCRAHNQRLGRRRFGPRRRG